MARTSIPIRTSASSSRKVGGRQKQTPRKRYSLQEQRQQQQKGELNYCH